VARNVDRVDTEQLERDIDFLHSRAELQKKISKKREDSTESIGFSSKAVFVVVRV
jgi:hypothetical protein